MWLWPIGVDDDNYFTTFKEEVNDTDVMFDRDVAESRTD